MNVKAKHYMKSQMTAMKAGLKNLLNKQMKKAKAETLALIMLNREDFETF